MEKLLVRAQRTLGAIYAKNYAKLLPALRDLGRGTHSVKSS